AAGIGENRAVPQCPRAELASALEKRHDLAFANGLSNIACDVSFSSWLRDRIRPPEVHRFARFIPNAGNAEKVMQKVERCPHRRSVVSAGGKKMHVFERCPLLYEHIGNRVEE